MKRATVPEVPLFAVDRDSATTISYQLFNHFRGLILSCRLARDTRLPSTRTLADQLGVSRNSVSDAFARLQSEGFITSRVGDGTRVRGPAVSQASLRLGQRQLHKRTPLALSRRGQLLASRVVPPGQKAFVPFARGVPAFEAFPAEIWSRLVARHCRNAHRDLLAYGQLAGYQPLREAISTYVRTVRGVVCDADQVIVVNGSQQAIDLAARVLLDPGNSAWMEEPGYSGAIAALRSAEIDTIPIPVDDEGIVVSAGMRLAPKARLAYVTPSHQFPTGAALSHKRRIELLEWAGQRRWILEDDFDNEYCSIGNSLPPLQSLDQNDSVIYINTFSRVLFPSLRLGYMIVPHALVDSFMAARSTIDRGSPLIEQAALADFIEQGYFAQHVRNTRELYIKRLAALANAVQQHIGDKLELRNTGGMHAIGYLPPGTDDERVARAASDRGVDVRPLSSFYSGKRKRSGLFLGFAAFTEKQIIRAVQIMAEVLRKTTSGPRE